MKIQEEVRVVLTSVLVVFVVFKLTHTIDWPWWWVLCPFWAPLPLVALAMTRLGVMLYKNRKRS